MKSMCLTVLLLTLTVSWTAFAADIKVAEIIKVGPGHSPRWSPDGSHILYARGGTMSVYDVDKRECQVVGEKHSRVFEWLNDSVIVFLKNHRPEKGRPRHSAITYASIIDGRRTLAIDSTVEIGHQRPPIPRLLTDGVGSIGTYTRDTVRMIGVNRDRLTSRPMEAFAAVSDYGMNIPNKDSDIWLIDTSANRVKRVTHRGGYAEPILSPDGSYVCAWDVKGDTGLVIFTVDGGKMASHRDGSVYCWSHQSDAVYFGTVYDDGDDLTGGELYYYSLETNRVTQLTDTPDIVEMDHAISPDGTMLVYRNYGKDRGGLDILVLERSE